MDAQAVSYESAANAPPEQASSLDPGALLGLLSLLGSSEGSNPASAPASGSARESSGDERPDADRAAMLLHTLQPYLRDTRVLSVERVIRLLETARGVRGLLHSVGPLLGDFLGGKS